MKYVFRKDPFYARDAREKEMSDDLMFSKHEETTFDICEFCRYNPPSSFGGKPCTVCPASGREIKTNADRIKAMRDVDPETLPIVQKLRDELARVTAERDAAICLCGKLIALCSPPKEWVPKLFRRHINRPGDYMGSGYDFLDSFNRIFDNFVETADDEFYTAICGAAEKEILERKQKMAGKKEG